jgi:hypothetical protein
MLFSICSTYPCSFIHFFSLLCMHLPHLSTAGLRLVSVRMALRAWFVLVSVVCSCCFSLFLFIYAPVRRFSANAVFCVGLYCWVGSLSVPFGFLIDFLPLPPFPLFRLFVAHCSSRGTQDALVSYDSFIIGISLQCVRSADNSLEFNRM